MALSFEQGPIRPPSEARSLLIRVTRNCPWNRCEFCPVYKGAPFSRRTVEEIKADIDTATEIVDTLKRMAWQGVSADRSIAVWWRGFFRTSATRRAFGALLCGSTTVRKVLFSRMPTAS